MKRFPLILACLLLMPGCTGAERKEDTTGEAYPLDAKTVIARARTAEVPIALFGERGFTFDARRSEEAEGRRIIWALRNQGSELFRYVATITPEAPDRTRVFVTLQPGSSAGSAAIFAKIKANPDFANIYKVAMIEAVDAKIEQREFRLGPAYHEMMTVMLNHKELMFQGLPEQTARDRKRYVDNAERAYRAAGSDY